MGEYSVGEALNLFLERSNWKPKVNELRLREDWEKIVGKTIARYTERINLMDKKLYIHTDVAALKQELQLGKVQLIVKINTYYNDNIVSEIIIQ